MTDEIQALRRTLRGLVALTSLPVLWTASTPRDIVESLAGVLKKTCPQIDLIYILLNQQEGGDSLELVRTNQELITGEVAHQIGKTFAPWLKADPSNSVLSVANPLTDGFLNIAVIPIGHSGNTGFVVAGAQDSQALSDLDRLLISVAANQAMTALQQAQLLADLRTANHLKDVAFTQEQNARQLLQTRVRLQSVIADLGQEAIISFDLPSLMHKAAFLLTETLEIEYAKILELIPEENKLLLKAGVGWKEGYVGHLKVTADYGSQAGYALISHGPVIVDDLNNETRFNDMHMLSEHHVKSGISVIIESSEGPWGVLGVHSTQQRVFSTDDIYFVQSVANVLGAALERSRLNSLLETQRQRFTNIIATVPGVIWENHHTDDLEEMKLVFISAYVETMLGYTVEEALAEPHFWLKIFHPEDAQKTVEAFNRVRQSGGSGVVNFRAVHKNGQVIDIHAPMISILKDGKPVGKRGVMMDVSERQRLMDAQVRYAEMLRRSNEELQQFAYVASHDLQEPLRMVVSYLQLLQNRYTNKLDSDAHEFIAYAVDGATRMKALIIDLLEYSRVAAGEKVFKEFDAQLALDRALANLALNIQDSGAIITSDTMPYIKADTLQMTQLFQNLIGNAIKFQKEARPQIHIGVERKPNEWQFAVRDNGIGIAPEYLDRIFVIFQRLHRKDEYPGTGIGLSICKKVIERHGGRIWVKSVPQQGTTFYFTIPV